MKKKQTVAGTPADPTVGYVKLELGGTTYSLIYDFDAIARAEEMSGMPLLFGVDWTKITAPRLRAMLCAVLLKAHPDMTPEKLTKYITHKNILKIQSALIDAWAASTPEKENASAQEENDSATGPPEPAD